MKLKEMTPNQLRKLAIEQDRLLTRSINQSKAILRDWEFWTNVWVVGMVVVYLLGIATGLIISLK